MDWPAFCQAYAESSTVRSSFVTASKIYDNGEKEQSFRVRGSVANTNALEVSLSKQYMALTHDQVLQTLKVPAETFEDLRFVTLTNENGEPTVFYLFEMEFGQNAGNFRIATFASHHQLVHEELLVEPQRNLRKEQPVERYQVCAKAEVESRQLSNVKGVVRSKAAAGAPLMTLAEARTKAAAIIEAREAHEAAQSTGEVPPGTVPMQVEPVYAEIERVEASVLPGAKPAKNARRKGQGAGAGGQRKRLKKSPERSPRSTLTGPTPTSAAEDEGPGDGDDLAATIKSKVGGDVKSIKNLDVGKILAGEQLGRSIAGASRLI